MTNYTMQQTECNRLNITKSSMWSEYYQVKHVWILPITNHHVWIYHIIYYKWIQKSPIHIIYYKWIQKSPIHIIYYKWIQKSPIHIQSQQKRLNFHNTYIKLAFSLLYGLWWFPNGRVASMVFFHLPRVGARMACQRKEFHQIGCIPPPQQHFQPQQSFFSQA